MISKVYNCDCMKYMASIPDKFFDLVIADPPYGIDIGHGLGSGKKNCKMHYGWQLDAPSEDFFNELFRVSKEQIIWGGNYFHLPLCDNWIVWDKMNYNLSFGEGELAWCSIHRKLRIFKHCSTKVDGKSKIHPTQKPIALYAWILRTYGGGMSRIFDPMMGSQSSRIAAYKMGFDFWGCELDKEYFDRGNERFERECHGIIKTSDGQEIKQLSIFDLC